MEHVDDVDLQQGGFVNGTYVDAISEVAAGKADFGLTGDYTLVQARADGKPVVAIASVLQRNPTAIISLGKSNIRKPQDLIGKKVAVADGGACLDGRQILRAFIQPEQKKPGTDRTAADDHAFVSGFDERRDLGGQLAELRGIERVAFRPSKNSSAEFQNDTHELLGKCWAVPRWK